MSIVLVSLGVFNYIEFSVIFSEYDTLNYKFF